MRLNELTTQHALVPQDDDLEEYMMRNGFTRLGYGRMGSVYTNDKLGYAIKLFDPADEGYLAFLRFALANQGNPHLPRFRGKFKQLAYGLYACRMEMLAPIPEGALESTIDRMFLFTDDPKEVPTEIASELPSTFLETINALDDFRRSHSLVWDLIATNVMLRDQTLVITDPFD